MKKKYKEFKSAAETTLVITYEDKQWEVPADVPAYVGLELLGKENRPEDEQAQMELFLDILKATVGDEKYNDIARTVGYVTFIEIAKYVMGEVLGVDFDKVDEEGKPLQETSESPLPSTQSLPTGPSLRPISGGIGLVDPETISEAVG